MLEARYRQVTPARNTVREDTSRGESRTGHLAKTGHFEEGRTSRAQSPIQFDFFTSERGMAASAARELRSAGTARLASISETVLRIPFKSCAV